MSSKHRFQLLMMLDEFPALGRLDFFETTLAFIAGYGIRAFLIAQSLNQISKAYGENNSILDNCHVRIAFSTNDERTAKRISDALGTATEQRAQRNYAGHRLSPWLAHVMVSRQETARPLLTPGEIMQLAPSDELVLVSGLAPIRARKLRYFEDSNFMARRLPPPHLSEDAYVDKPAPRADDWANQVCSVSVALREALKAEEKSGATAEVEAEGDADTDGKALQQVPELAPQMAAAKDTPDQPAPVDDEADLAADKKAMDRTRLTRAATTAATMGSDRRLAAKGLNLDLFRDS